MKKVKKCPKCGADGYIGMPKYACGSWSDEDGWPPIEGAKCIKAQRDQLSERVKLLEGYVRSLGYTQVVLSGAPERWLGERN